MKKLLLFFFIFLSIQCLGQGGYLKPNNSYGTIQNRASIDSTLFFPTGSGSPSLHGFNLHKAAQFFDSTNHRMWVYDPKRAAWDSVHLGVGGGGDISMNKVAYVDINGDDGTAVVNNPSKQFATIDAACAALGGPGVIKIGIGTFDSPVQSNILSGMKFYGSGKPTANITYYPDGFGTTTQSVPDRLIGGTILNGTFSVAYDQENITISNLGIDVGNAWCVDKNSGNATDGLLIAQYYDLGGGLSSADGIHKLQTETNPRTNIIVKDVTVICRDAVSTVHAALFENCYNPIVDNLTTYYGFAGIVIKTIGGTFTNLFANGHGTHGIVLKDNDYSRCRDVVVKGFHIRSIEDWDGDGLSLSSGHDAGSNNVFNCTISNGVIENTQWGIHNYGSKSSYSINISNVNIFNSLYSGVRLTHIGYSSISNVTSWLTGNDQGFYIVNDFVQSTSVSNCSSLASKGDGFFLQGTTTYPIIFSNLIASDNHGYGIVISGDGVNGFGNFCQHNTSGDELQGNRMRAIGINTSQPIAQLDINGTFRVRDTAYIVGGAGGVTDTTNYKPLGWKVADNAVVRFSKWPVTSSGSGMVYPGAGIANSTGSAWGTSYSTSGTGSTVALTSGPTFLNFVISGNISASAWTTGGIRIKEVASTLTDQTSSGTVATAYTNVLGGNTIAATSSTIFTNYVSTYSKDPVAGSNVTLTNRWALGAESARFGTSNQATISNAGVIKMPGIASDNYNAAALMVVEDTANGTLYHRAIPTSGGGSLAIGQSITSGTSGSVLFSGASGKLSQINSKLFYDSSNIRLGVGNSSPSYLIHATTTTNANSIINVNSTSNGTAGAAVFRAENNNSNNITFGITGSGFTPVVGINADQAYIYTGSSNGIAILSGASAPIIFKINGGEKMRFDQNGSFSIGSAANAAASSLVDMTSTTKGVLPPRMTTTQRDAIASPAEGLHIYNTTTHAGNYYNGTSWVAY